MGSRRNGERLSTKLQMQLHAVRLRLGAEAKIPPDVLKTLDVKIKPDGDGFSYEVTSSWVSFTGWSRTKDPQALQKRLWKEAVRAWKADWY